MPEAAIRELAGARTGLRCQFEALKFERLSFSGQHREESATARFQG